MTIPTDLECLWANPDQAGSLKKHTHGRFGGWQERFFVLKGSILYYFKNRNNVKKLHGIIPLERARVQSEPPPGYVRTHGGNAQHQHNLCITITFHVQHAYIAKYPFYVLLAPTSEVHKAWLEALNCASIPRAALLAKLAETGAMNSVFATCTEEAKVCFPTTSAAVISSSACLRIPPQQPENAISTVVSGDAVVMATATTARVAAGAPNRTLPPQTGAKIAAVSPQSRPVVEITAASAVYATPTSNNTSRSSTPAASRISSATVAGATAAATATTPEGKKALSTRSSTQHVHQDQQESPSLRNTFGVLASGSPEISTAAA